MMPLTVAGVGVASTIKKIGGKEETRKFLENLGFVVGGDCYGRIRNRWKHDC